MNLESSDERHYSISRRIWNENYHTSAATFLQPVQPYTRFQSPDTPCQIDAIEFQKPRAKEFSIVYSSDRYETKQSDQRGRASP